MTAAQTVWALHASELTGKEVTVLPGVIDPDEQGEIGLLFHNGSKEEDVWNTGDHVGLLLVISCPVMKVNGKPQQPSPGRILMALQE